jgi:menaquinone-dependent protoporphyrinogen oxidase
MRRTRIGELADARRRGRRYGRGMTKEVTVNGPVLVAHASRYGSTQEVAEAVAAILRAADLEVEVTRAEDVPDLAPYGAVVLGAALYAGRLQAGARHFLSRHAEALPQMPFAVFAMGPTSSEEKDLEGARTQLGKALARVPDLTPVVIATFGGVVRPEKLHFPFNHMPAADARDWDAIQAFGREVAAALAATPAV